jgi:hypothetical protein
MKKKTAIIGGFLLLVTTTASVAGLLYFQSYRFQQEVQSMVANKALGWGHLHFGMGDLEQMAIFPVAKGRMRLNLHNTCNDTLLDLGVLEYQMGQLPLLNDEGQLAWFAPEAKAEDLPLARFAVSKEGENTLLQLQQEPWMSTLALDPALSIKTGPEGHSIRAAAKTIKLPAVTGDPSDFLARDFQMAFTVPAGKLSDSRFEAKAGQIGFETQNIQGLDLTVNGEVVEGDQTRWLAELETGALMYESLLLESTQGTHELTIGDSNAAHFLLTSSVQSCGGYATASSHEFNVRAALSKLISAGLSLKSKTELKVLGQTVKWAMQTEFNQQNDSRTGYLDLTRSLQVETEFAMPFDRLGTLQQNLFLKSGLFKEEDVRKAYKRSFKANSGELLSQMRAANKGTFAQESGRTATQWLKDVEQALYLKDFSFASSGDKVPRIAFEGLKDVAVDKQGNPRMQIRVSN